MSRSIFWAFAVGIVFSSHLAWQPTSLGADAMTERASSVRQAVDGGVLSGVGFSHDAIIDVATRGNRSVDDGKHREQLVSLDPQQAGCPSVISKQGAE